MESPRQDREFEVDESKLMGSEKLEQHEGQEFNEES